METAHRPIRRATLAATLALVALVATSCAGGLVGTSPAATVDGTDISREDVQQAVDGTRSLIEVQIAASQQALDEADPSQPAAFTQEALDASAAEALAPYGDEDGSYPTELASSELTQLIRDELIRQELERLDALPTDEDLEAARQSLVQQIGGEEFVDQLDDEVVDFVVGAQARAAAFQAAMEPDPEEREQELRELYETMAPSLPLCLNLLYVQTEPEADEARARVEGGEAFGDVAAEVSLSQATQATGGFVGCIDAQTAEATLSDDLSGTSVGEVAGPFALDPGDGTEVFAVVQVESTDGGTFEQLRPQLEAEIPSGEQVLAEAANEATLALLEAAEVTVDPRYGTWDTTDFVVVAPTVPGEDPGVDGGPTLVPDN